MRKMLGRLDEVRSCKYNDHEINIDGKSSNKQEHSTSASSQTHQITYVNTYMSK